MSNDLARRDSIVESTVVAARAEGRDIDAEAVGREIARNFGVIDRARSIGEIRDPEPREQKAPPPRADVDHAQSFAARMGSTMWQAPVSAADDAPQVQLAGNDMLRALAMKARILLLMEPVPGYKLKITKDPKTGMVTDCEPIGNACRYPAFANRLRQEFACFASRQGTYRDMKYADRWRKHLRAVEDILDKSDAAVGVNWWVR